MKSLTNRSKSVTNRQMSWLEKIYLPAIVGGLWITFKHIFKKKATVKWPDEERPRSEVYRGKHVLKRDENGAERCTACGLCAVACPAEAITMISEERKTGEELLYREEKYASVYEINMLRCIFCGLCEEACPKEAIFLTQELAPANYERQDFIYGKDRLVETLEKRVNISNRQEEAVVIKKYND